MTIIFQVGDYIKMVKTTISYNVPGLCEVPRRDIWANEVSRKAHVIRREHSDRS
jgi:hypothetical protein